MGQGGKDEVALEIGNLCYPGNKGKILLQALPVRSWRPPLPSFRVERLSLQTQKQKIVCESKQLVRNPGMQGRQAVMASGDFSKG